MSEVRRDFISRRNEHIAGDYKQIYLYLARLLVSLSWVLRMRLLVLLGFY